MTNLTTPLFTDHELSSVRMRDATLTERVTDLIQSLIVDRRLPPGARLPSLRELAEQFGVSRTVVREAIGALVAKDLLEVRHGSGTTVRSPSTRSVSQSLSLMLRIGNAQIDYSKISEVRRLLEVEIAGLAAQRRTNDDLTFLNELLNDMPNHVTNRVAWAKNDVAFHATLAQATQNEVYSVLLDSIADLMMSVRYIGFNVAGTRTETIGHHRAVFEQVKLQSVEGAKAAMLAHLLDAESVQKQAMAMKEEGGE